LDGVTRSTILVLTFNTGNDLIAPNDLVAMIDRSGATVVGLQELSSRNAIALEEARLGCLPHHILYGEYINGKCLLSRYPIQGHEWLRLASSRTVIDARLEIEGRVVSVFVTHPSPPDYRRLEVKSRSALQDIVTVLDRMASGIPTLLLGDFNMVRRSQGYRLLEQAGLVDTFCAVGSGRGLTYPTRHQYKRIRLPRMVRIDYIWASRHFVPVASWVGPALGSDHLSLFSEVVLRKE
jgi:endonuclease/exonuclease/phosphatase family metal-dependent hydrolase